MEEIIMDKEIRYKQNPVSGCRVPYSQGTRNKWLEYWFSLNDIKYSHDGNHSILDFSKSKRKRRKLDMKLLQSYLITDSSFCEQEKIKEILDAYLTTWAHREEQKERSKILELISYSENYSSSKELERFVFALTGENGVVNIAVVKQFLWLVKRKMKELDVTRHLFPVLQGKQNSGKSTAVRKLLEPIKLFYSSRSLDMLNDSKELAVLARKNVIWFDEMSKASKADVDAIKLYTTSETVSYRILYSQNEATLRNVSTFIGCSNKSFVDIFYDPTGARRFYELKCQDKINHSKINKIDYIELWKSVDENDSNPPIEAHMKELEEAQEKIKALDSVEEFMIEEKLIPKANSEIITVPSNELYNAYTQWMKSQSRHSMFTKTKMGRRLTELGIETGKNRNTRLRYINKANLCGIVQLD
jgi:hypothetical protein